MIPLLVFYLHTVAAVWAFTKRFQEEGVKEGVLAVGFMAIIFSVGWTLTTALLQIVISPAGFGRGFDRDALSLLLLTSFEAVFYYYYLRK
jgi:hypothetical protein